MTGYSDEHNKEGIHEVHTALLGDTQTVERACTALSSPTAAN
ncbi:hypothetical protein PPEP_a3311 [Pseudoalteromonas peptidolytica F12-50-A1]|uniref:Uncharacterized protein n=1 Tax=Pseudoalteromonas peptidolytica F12-50-A1 TaxID=1315280 RepID=A0A8I0MYH9_9GAMM|nr:hypothetical protein [Pseudoalteromonas peptidolytica F12-50-A1]